MTESNHQIFPVLVADANLLPTVAQSQIGEQDTNFTHISLKPDIDVHDLVCKSLDVALET